MERYIRTKGGLIIDTQDTFPFMIVGDVIDFNSFGRFKIKSTADKIEDLCDAFVNVEIAGGFEGEFHVYRDFELAKYAADEKVTEIYGAIRTDKGLAYVAKMNEKGKLELL